MGVVKSIPFPKDRLPNDPWSDGPRPRCPQCGNDGVIVVAIAEGSGTDEAAPCPDCRLGFMSEFNYGGKIDGKTGDVTFFQGRTHWGREGYWSRHAMLKPGERVEQEPLPDEENKRRTRILGRAISASRPLTDEELADIYRDDPAGLAEHHRLSGMEDEKAARVTAGYYRRWGSTPERRRHLRQNVIPRLRNQGLVMAAVLVDEWVEEKLAELDKPHELPSFAFDYGEDQP